MTRSEIVGANILKHRTALGMNQVDFADAIGRSQTMISMYEKGQRLPSTQILAQIAKVLGVSFGELYFSEEERNADMEELDDPMPQDRLTKDEQRLLRAYRESIPEIRRTVIQLLELNKAQKSNLA